MASESATKAVDTDTPTNADCDMTCAICLEEVMKNPVKLPCGHRFCAACSEKWRSKYDSQSQRKCPTCRSSVPPTKEMVLQMKGYEQITKLLQDKLDSPDLLWLPDDYKLKNQMNVSDEGYAMVLGLEDRHDHDKAVRYALSLHLKQTKSIIAEMEDRLSGGVGGGDTAAGNGLLEITEHDHGGEKVEELPENIQQAAVDGGIDPVLQWLAIEDDTVPRMDTVPYARINAKCGPPSGSHHVGRGGIFQRPRLAAHIAPTRGIRRSAK
jgi:hypothetical protein